MNSLVPAPDTIPVAWGYFRFLLMLVFPLHLLLMNAMVGTTAIAAYAFFKRDDDLDGLAHELARTIPFLVAFAVNLGVAALLFMQVLYGNLFYTSSILMGVFWIAVIPLLIVAYYSAYLFDFRFRSLPRPAAAALIVLALLIFPAIAFIFSNNMTLMLAPAAWKGYFANMAGTMLNLGERSLVPRYLHIMTGAMAVGGLSVALMGRLRRGMAPRVRAAAERVGMRVFITLTGLQIVLGFVFLLSLPRPVMALFMGGDPMATLHLVTGVALAIALLMAGMARKVCLCAAGAVVLVFVMVFLRDLVRGAYLKPVFSPDTLHVVPQYSPMVMFFAALVAGLAVCAWLVRKAFPPSKGF